MIIKPCVMSAFPSSCIGLTWGALVGALFVCYYLIIFGKDKVQKREED